MVMQRHSIKHDNFLRENEHIRGAEAYPVDLSLFLDMSQEHPAPRDRSSVSSLRDDPIVIAQYALLWWNNYLASGNEQSREAFLRAALWLVEQALHFGDDAMGWPLVSAHTLYFTRGSWLSSIAQGCGLSALMRAYQLTGDDCFLETAHYVARTFERDILDGGVCSPVGANGVFFEEVAVYPAAHTLHGCVFALLGLYDYVAITENSQMLQYIRRGETTLHNVFDEFDLHFWTRADLHQRGLTTPAQLAQQTLLLRALAGCTKCSQCAVRASRWHQYQCRPLSHIRYKFAHHEALLKRALLRLVRTVIMSKSPAINPMSAPRLRVCVPVTHHPAPGGMGTFLDRMARIMVDRWQLDYLTQRIGPDAGERVMHRFGRTWMTPWHFPQVWLYVLTGARKLLSLMHRGANYELIIPQDGVFSAAFAALVGKLTGVRVVCFDHSTLTWFKSRNYSAEKWRYLEGKTWPWLFLQLVRLLLAFYWPSLHLLARFATAQADHFLIPGVPGDEIDAICRELRIPASQVTRFNLTVDMQRHEALSAEERAARRASMNIPIDALVIAIAARLDPEKGLDISMESISRVVSSLPPALSDRVRVMIAGDGKLRGWLEEEIRRRELSHVCRMMGYVSNKEIQSLLEASDILLYTSTRGACMPLAVLEGMAASCAVIASDEPLANVYVLAEERGIVVPAGDLDQTGIALERLLRDNDLRDQMGKAARDYISLHHSAEAFRRVLLRASYWSELDQLLEAQIESLEDIEVMERGQCHHQ
jgi:glycosyltransferase involved in cell wall biosynthesis